MGIGDWGLGIGDWGLGPIPKLLINLIFHKISIIFILINYI